jgi:hypothetical protein
MPIASPDCYPESQYVGFSGLLAYEVKLPQTITTSYGDEAQTVPHDYAVTVCLMFAQLGARGTSVLFCTGDSGVGSRDCETNDGRNVTQFQPSFPASCKPSPLLVYCTFGWLLVDALLRSLRYCRQSNNRCQPRDRRLLLWRRILKLLRSTSLSD